MITFACRKPWENANSIVGDARDVLGLNKGANVTFVSGTEDELLLANIQLLTFDRQDLVSPWAPG